MVNKTHLNKLRNLRAQTNKLKQQEYIEYKNVYKEIYIVKPWQPQIN